MPNSQGFGLPKEDLAEFLRIRPQGSYAEAAWTEESVQVGRVVLALNAERAVVSPEVEPSSANLTRMTVKDKELDNYVT